MHKLLASGLALALAAPAAPQGDVPSAGALVRQLESEDAAVQSKARAGLIALGKKAVGPLTSTLLFEQDPEACIPIS